MKATELILTSLRFHRNLTRKYVEDIPDDDLTMQPAGLVNHAAWQLGHITTTLISGARAMGVVCETPDAWEATFGTGSVPVPKSAAYPSKAELLEAFDAAAAAFEAAVRVVDEATLAKPTPSEGFRRVAPTIGDAVFLLASGHFAFHLGQLSAWRKARGLPPAFGG